ncbi:MAG: DNA-directed RNA polymerase subunit D [Nanoarchaeota archaeon]
MEKIKQKENQITFKTDMNETLANAIRRYLGQVPVLAIDEVEISKNDSPLYDETLAHRLGLVPLQTPKNVGKSTEKELALKSKKEGFVLSGELEGDVKVVYENIPLTLLNKGQEINIKCFVKSGKGKDHAKFSPGMIYYTDVVDVKLNNCPKEVLEICPKGVLEEKDGKVIVSENAKYNRDGVEACVEALKSIKKQDCIEFKPTGEIAITIESFGQLSPQDMFLKSVEKLKDDFADMEKQIK